MISKKLACSSMSSESSKQFTVDDFIMSLERSYGSLLKNLPIIISN